jgi:hypothetical protein
MARLYPDNNRDKGIAAVSLAERVRRLFARHWRCFLAPLDWCC